MSDIGNTNLKPTIVVVAGSGDTGKTSTLRELANLFLRTPTNVPRYVGNSASISIPNPPLFQNAPILTQGDFRLIINVNKHWVAIESMGDIGTHLQYRLEYLATGSAPNLPSIPPCELIFCAATDPVRPRQNLHPVAEVENFAHNKGYQIIWTSTVLLQSTLRSILCAAGPHLNAIGPQTDNAKAALLERLGASLGFYP
ncbi:MAG: hypothetical protein LBT53_03005 [Puniceicoccales bacterium]|jgi:hypothetical protein|nr:hypothetical protein [Puniceicoccales bacterium]